MTDCLPDRIPDTSSDIISGIPPSITPGTRFATRLADKFGRAASTYHVQAQLQQECAHRLLDLLDGDATLEGRDRLPPFPPGPILELGCGTGFVTDCLWDRFHNPAVAASSPPHREIHITDLSPQMVQFCQSRFQSALPALRKGHVSSGNPCPSRCDPPLLRFYPLDAESSLAAPNTYSLIIGGFVAQWFQQLESTIHRLLRQLQPGGRLLLSFPGSASFPEWRQMCDRLHLPFTAHPLPDPQRLWQTLDLAPHQYRVQMPVEWCPTLYDTAADFFHSLKAIGAGMSRSGQHLTPRQMRQLLQTWQPFPPVCDAHPDSSPKIVVQYQVVYLHIIKQASGEVINANS